MKFGQLIVRKTIKIVATRCQILRLKCTNIDFGWGSALHWGSLQRCPDSLPGNGIKETYTSKGMGDVQAGEGEDS